MKSIPRGEEILFQNKKFSSFNSRNPSFFLSTKGKVYIKDKDNYIIKFFMPLILSVDPKNIPSPKELKDVSPWMIQCKGGFTDDILKRKFHLWHVEHWSFPEATVVEVMVDIFSRELFELESKFLQPRKHKKFIQRDSGRNNP
jgi:hypothetical protein